MNTEGAMEHCQLPAKSRLIGLGAGSRVKIDGPKHLARRIDVCAARVKLGQLRAGEHY
jgi:hypothetical protein